MVNQSVLSISLVSSLLHVFLVLNLYGVNGDTGAMISDLCKNISAHSYGDPKYDFCISSLKANPMSKTSDIFGLALISMELCSTNATNVSIYVRKNGAFDTVQDAMEAFKDKDYEGALGVGVARIWAGTCKDGFDEFGLDFGPLSKQHVKDTTILTHSKQ
ncbi:putative invertase inhibitor [Papaver somniferum]|uniref:putative invertase inhibitor n=1 Tax=Papaver somniferum TaxID=3469 RepID=UPI000E700CFE|nr:putative invertase inhibitor [Papaver somniferum]